MAEALPLRMSMNFAYGEPRELASGVVRVVANNPNHFRHGRPCRGWLPGSSIG